VGAQFPEAAVTHSRLLTGAGFVLAFQSAIPTLGAQSKAPPGQPDSVTIRIVSTELRTAVQIVQQYLEKPVIFSGAGNGAQVSLETPRRRCG